VDGFVKNVSTGLSMSYMTQRYVLSVPLSGVSVNQLSSAAFSFGAGVLAELPLNLSVGVAADDLNQPNLGVVGSDRLPTVVRWGVAERLLDKGFVHVTATAAQSLSNADLETQGGMELFFPDYGVRVRGGYSTYEGSVGVGWADPDLFVDYAYLFSVSQESQISGSALPGSHLFEIGLQWGSTAQNAVYGEYMRRGKDSETAAQWDKALWCYLQALDAKPADIPAIEGRERVLARYNVQRAAKYYADGQEALKRGFFLDARNDFEMANQLMPGNPEYVKAFGTMAAYTPLNDKNVSPAKKEAVQEAKTMSTQADLYLSKGRPDLAKKNLEEALKTQPQNPELKQKLAQLEAPKPRISDERVARAQELYNQGLKMYLEGDLDGAIQAWQQALKANPDHTKAQNNLIHAQLEKEAGKS
jgi:tetratricopeptide (TPR) repeat protein